MNDTNPKILSKMREMIQKKTPAERFFMGSSMYDFSRQLVLNALLQENPQLTPSALKRELFLRFYGNDFDCEKKEKILGYLNRL